MIKLLISDFDGTLVDTFEANLKAYQEAFHSVGLNITADTYRDCYGLRFDAFMKAVGVKDAAIASEIRSAKAEAYPKYFDLLKVNKELVGMLMAFRRSGGKIAIASTAREKNLMAVLNHIGLVDCWDFIMAGEQVKLGKPAPFIYYDILKHFDVTPDEAIAFEDSEVGIKAAKQAGLNYIKINKEFYGN